MAGARRILVVNPNTTEAVTQGFLDVARRIAPAGLAFDGVTGRFGARIVSNEAENVIAGHSVLDLIAEHAAGHDAVILAISFDTALLAARAMLPIPVIGITEAALAAAQEGGRRVGVVFFGEISRPVYERVFASYGVSPVASAVVEFASAADYLAAEAKDRAVAEACRRLADQGAEAAVICGAAAVGMAARLQPDAPIPLFDGAAAIARCAAELAAPSPAMGAETGPRPKAIGDLVGLSPALTALLRGDAEPQ